MPELKTVLMYVEITVAAVAAMLLGDLLGYRIGRTRLAIAGGIIVLAAIIAFAIYAAIKLR